MDTLMNFVFDFFQRKLWESIQCDDQMSTLDFSGKLFVTIVLIVFLCVAYDRYKSSGITKVLGAVIYHMIEPLLSQ